MIAYDKHVEGHVGTTPWRRHAQLIDGDDDLDIDMDDSGAHKTFSDRVRNLTRLRSWRGLLGR